MLLFVFVNPDYLQRNGQPGDGTIHVLYERGDPVLDRFRPAALALSRSPLASTQAGAQQ
ncbi:MAG: hypothetical protein JNL98_26685 [Bryobacterales bacterium]|nr:hypothetical protein [Bryobacterales bacterium]